MASKIKRAPREHRPQTVRIRRWEQGQMAQATDQLAAEEPLEIRVDSRSVGITMRTPGHDEELAVGFLLTEGVIRRAADVQQVRPYQRNLAGNVVDVLLAPEVTVDFARLTRHVFASSSCGLCGKASITLVRGQFAPMNRQFMVAVETLLSLPAQMRAAQTDFAATGGLHAAALFSAEGRLLLLREDIGHHNAADKVIGRCVLDGVPSLDRHVLLVSGRCSSAGAARSRSCKRRWPPASPSWRASPHLLRWR